MPVRRVTVLILVACFTLSACVVRGPVRMVPDGVVTELSKEVFVATNRESFLSSPKRGRSEDLRYFRYDVRIPPNRQSGDLGLPDHNVDPDRDFLAKSASEYPTSHAFTRVIRQKLSALPADERGIVVYVHGFNTTFSEGVMRLAQLDHDLGLPGAAVHFSWPSAASVSCDKARSRS